MSDTEIRELLRRYDRKARMKSRLVEGLVGLAFVAAVAFIFFVRG